MKSLLRVKMATRPYLKKYITLLEGEEPVINNRTTFGRFVFAMLDKTVIRDDKYSPKWLSEESNTETLILRVTHRTFEHIGHTITTEKSAYINLFLMEQFDQALTLSAAKMHFLHQVSIKNALVAFCSLHNIEIDRDITIDSLLKKWHRTFVKLDPGPKSNQNSFFMTPYPPAQQLNMFE